MRAMAIPYLAVDGSSYPRTSAGINSAITDAYNAGGAVVLLDGTYTLSATIYLKSNVILLGRVLAQF